MLAGDDENDVFDSVTWETPATAVSGYETEPFVEADEPGPGAGPGFRQSLDTNAEGRSPHDPKWEGYLLVSVKDPVKELDGTKDAYVSYAVSAKTNLPMFRNKSPSARRRFQDFVFMRDNLAKDFPACVVPPLPDKHRLEYVTGDRFSTEFIERRRQDLDRFLQRLAAHPTLQRSALLRDFLESTEWNVKMHQHIAHPPGPEPAPSLFDNISDTLLNAFARVRKPDERFLEIREGMDKFEDSLATIDRLWSRSRSRANDLTQDYHDLAVSVQGLGFLESGITDPLNHFSNTLLEFSAIMRHTVGPPSSSSNRPALASLTRFLTQTHNTMDPLLQHLHSLLAYSHTHRAVLKLRDQKQLDFEELSDYLSGVVSERDRLAAIVSGRVGSSGLGLGAYLRDRVDQLRGADDDRSRVEKMKKLDQKIKELQEAVTIAHETSDAFSDETLREHAIFQHAKQAEMKEMLGALADGQIEMYKASMEEWDRIIPIIQRIRVDV